MVRALTPLVVLVLALPPVAGAQEPSISPEERTRIDSVFSAWDRTNSPGCALGIERGGAILYQRDLLDLTPGPALRPVAEDRFLAPGNQTEYRFSGNGPAATLEISGGPWRRPAWCGSRPSNLIRRVCAGSRESM